LKPIEIALGLSSDVQNGLKSGIYYRDGGVIRSSENSRIIALLKDVDIPKEPENIPNLNAFNQIPSAIMGFQLKEISKKLEIIEFKINQVHEAAKETKERVEAIHIKIDAQIFSDLIGPIKNAQITLDENRLERLVGYREQLVKAESTFQSVINRYLNNEVQKRFKLYPEEIAAYSTGLLLCLIAIRDISVHLNEKYTAQKYTEILKEQGLAVQNLLESITSNPSSLFWLTDIHRNVILGHRENVNRIKSQDEQLQILMLENDGLKRWVEYALID
jgi:hypothetical protein